MPVYFEYLLKVSLCLALVFLFYTLLLKQMTYYTWNRYFLLLFTILSFIIPFININAFVEVQQQSSVSFINQIPSINVLKKTGVFTNNLGIFNYQPIFTTLFLLVSFILLLRLLIQLFSIQKIKAKASLIHSGEIKTYHLPRSVLPFSFLNCIFVNIDNYSKNELQEIIDHETVHVQQQHTIDVLITEAICIFNWYNPFAWLIKKAVRENLEFIADDVVIRKGVNKKSYQYLLLKVTGDISLSVANSLTFSSLKNRISMMNKTKTSPFQLLKFMLLIPVTGFLLLAFRDTKENVSNTTEVKSASGENYILSTLTYSIADEKVKAIVIKEKDKSLLKQGDILNLKQIYNEKYRLKSLLERNGYNKLKSNAIMFWVDTASVKNSFSVEIKIDVEPSLVSQGNKKLLLFNNQLIALNYTFPFYPRISSKANKINLFAAKTPYAKFTNYCNLNNSITTSLI